jgi:hypothetical protein
VTLHRVTIPRDLVLGSYATHHPAILILKPIVGFAFPAGAQTPLSRTVQARRNLILPSISDFVFPMKKLEIGFQMKIAGVNLNHLKGLAT